MKFKTTFFCWFFSISLFAQSPEALIPSEAHSVITINNIQLLEEISLEELIQYDFMEEVQQELFDGSTSGKHLEDIGIDFNQRMNFFKGESEDYEVNGVTFGVKNEQELFATFDDFEKIESGNPTVQLFESFFNRIAIQGKSAIFYRLEPKNDKINSITDSIWSARGNDLYWEEEVEPYIEMEEVEEGVLEYEEEEEAVLEYAEEEYAEEIVDETELASEKTYHELRDSVEMEVIATLSKTFNHNLFSERKTLLNSDQRFAQRLNSSSEAIFFLDNEKITHFSANEFKSPLYYTFGRKLDILRENNFVSGNFNFEENKAVLDVDYNYSEKLGAIYEGLSQSKFDKKVLQYIPENNQGFFTYNINLKEAHDRTVTLLEEIFEETEGKSATMSLVVLDLWKELVNTEALFDTYRGSMFGSFLGVQKVKTKKIVFDYDEETYEYVEREEEAEEDLPIFSIGLSTNNRPFVERMLNRIAKIQSELTSEGNYWKIENALLNSVPLYIIPTDYAFIVTNDENQAKNYFDGYGKLALSKKQAKKAKKSQVMYAEVDVQKVLNKLPEEMMSRQSDRDMFEVLRKNVGTFTLTSQKATKDKMNYSITYHFDEKDGSFGKYALDLINSLYNITK